MADKRKDRKKKLEELSLEELEQKIKKDSNENSEVTLKLIKNPDILQGICSINNGKTKIVGFCAESENLLENAKAKIQKKGCDLLVANDISRKDIGFNADENDNYIIECVAQSDLIVACWGNNGMYMNRENIIKELVPNLYCLKKNKNGTPHHPLRLPRNIRPIPFNF